jgi:CRP-like cAMP-binding protein
MDKTPIPDCFECNFKNHDVLLCASHDTISRINQEKGFHNFKKGTYLFRAGEMAEGFYFLKVGLVRTFVHLASGKEQTFSLKASGDWVGFRDCISATSYNFNAVALEDSQACYVSGDLIRTLIQSDTSFQTEVFRRMAKGWRRMEEQVISLGTKQVHEKLAEVLIFLDHAQGDRNQVELKMTRDVLATLIGIKTETLVRALSDLKAREFISVERNRIDILNREALRSLARIA